MQLHFLRASFFLLPGDISVAQLLKKRQENDDTCKELMAILLSMIIYMIKEYTIGINITLPR